ncbi:MAG: DinB family protein [Gemmatimonadota bacterium]
MDQRINELISLLNQSYDARAWHGTTLKGAVRGVSVRVALWRPAPGRHNIWELVLHMAYWKYAVTRRLSGAARGGFPRAGSNWIAIEDPSARCWKADVKLLDEKHRALLAAVKPLSIQRLNSRDGSRWTNREQIVGAAAHDLYHTGQVQLIKRLSQAK